MIGNSKVLPNDSAPECSVTQGGNDKLSWLPAEVSGFPQVSVLLLAGVLMFALGKKDKTFSSSSQERCEVFLLPGTRSS